MKKNKLLELLKEYNNSDKVLKAGYVCFMYLKDLSKINNLNVSLELDLNLDDFAIRLPGEIKINEVSIKLGFTI